MVEVALVIYDEPTYRLAVLLLKLGVIDRVADMRILEYGFTMPIPAPFN